MSSFSSFAPSSRRRLANVSAALYASLYRSNRRAHRRASASDRFKTSWRDASIFSIIVSVSIALDHVQDEIVHPDSGLISLGAGPVRPVEIAAGGILTGVHQAVRSNVPGADRDAAERAWRVARRIKGWLVARLRSIVIPAVECLLCHFSFLTMIGGHGVRPSVLRRLNVRANQKIPS